jgi:hypothetical protein
MIKPLSLKTLIMKTTIRNSERNLNSLMSKLSGSEILSSGQLQKIRGGGADGDGGSTIIVHPPTKP